MIRAIVKKVVQGVIQRVSASAWGSGDIEDRELIQHYGYTSRPKEGAEVIIIREGGHFIAIGSDDRRYRIALEDGEVALYDDLGQKVQLTREGIVADSPFKVTVNAPEVNLGGSREELLALVDERILTLYNTHTHPGVMVGKDSTAPPAVPLIAAQVCTVVTKAK